jgi:hypothetical protein
MYSFYPEDGFSRFLRNIDNVVFHNMASNPRREQASYSAP